MIKHDKTKEAVLQEIITKTDSVLESDKKGMYAEEIRQRQMTEMDLLIDHYLKLLNSEGKDYNSLLNNTYQTYEKYTSFLHQLTQAEKDVNRKALQIVGKSESSSRMISKMEEATNNIRIAKANSVFKR